MGVNRQDKANVLDLKEKLPLKPERLTELANLTITATGPVAVRVTEPEKKGKPGKSLTITARQKLVLDGMRDKDRMTLQHYDRALPDTKFFLTHDQREYDLRRRIITEVFKDRGHAASIMDLNVGEIADRASSEVLDTLVTSPGAPYHFDLFRDYAVMVAYQVSLRAFGVRGTSRVAWWMVLPRLFKKLDSKRPLKVTKLGQEAHTSHLCAHLMIGQLFANFENRDGKVRFFGENAAKVLKRQIAESMKLAKKQRADFMAILNDHPDIERTDEGAPSDLVNILENNRGLPALADMSTEDMDRNIVGILFEFVGTMIFLVSSGFASVMIQMHRANETFATLAEVMSDRTRAEKYINEAMRLKSPTGVVTRTANTDFTFHDIDVRAGDYFNFAVPEACFDPVAFPEPRKFDPNRNHDDYVHFGPHDGPHRCLGPYWSREVIRQLCLKLACIPGLRFYPDQEKDGRREAFGTTDSWPVQFDQPDMKIIREALFSGEEK